MVILRSQNNHRFFMSLANHLPAEGQDEGFDVDYNDK